MTETPKDAAPDTKGRKWASSRKGGQKMPAEADTDPKGTQKKQRDAANEAAEQKDAESRALAELTLAKADAKRDLAIAEAETTKKNTMEALQVSLDAATEAEKDAKEALTIPTDDVANARAEKDKLRDPKAIQALHTSAQKAADDVTTANGVLEDCTANLKTAQDLDKAAEDAVASLAAIDDPTMADIKKSVKANALAMAGLLVKAKSAVDDARNMLRAKTALKADADKAVTNAQAASKAADADYAAKKKVLEKAKADHDAADLAKQSAQSACDTAEDTSTKQEALDKAKAESDYAEAEAAYFKTLADIAAAASCRKTATAA